MTNIEIKSVTENDYHTLSLLVGELLSEIMVTIQKNEFNFNQQETEQRAKDLIEDGKYWAFIAWDTSKNIPIGFISLYESYALYAEGAFGTIPELYVKPEWRQLKIGETLLNQAIDLSLSQGWKRLEVTTPPLPEFDKTLNFYQKNGFAIAGGRKLKISISND